MDSLIYQLPKIVDEGKKEVERILVRISGLNRMTLLTNDLFCRQKLRPDFLLKEMKGIKK